jgi:hypothetical protein
MVPFSIAKIIIKMEPNVAKFLVDRLSKEAIVTDFKVQFEFVNFKSYTSQEKISTETKIPEINAVW